MNSVIEKITEWGKIAANTIKENPEITQVWFGAEGHKVEDMRAAKEHFKIPNNCFYLSTSSPRMVLQVNSFNISGVTGFIYSEEVEVVEHIVVKSAIINV